MINEACFLGLCQDARLLVSEGERRGEAQIPLVGRTESALAPRYRKEPRLERELPRQVREGDLVCYVVAP